MADPTTITAGTASGPEYGLRAMLAAFRSGAPSAQIRTCWRTLHRWPGGKRLFSWLVGAMAPYSGNIGAEVEGLDKNFAQVRMRDRRRLRNHLRSAHAIALANLAEYTGNLALAYSMPANARFIVTRVDMRYFHKARGTITAVCRTQMPESDARREVEIVVDLNDASGVVVSQGTLTSLIGPIR